MSDYQDFQLTPETEENLQIAPDIPYHPGMVLVPVPCDLCKLLMYAAEEQVGQWKICPDCGRKTLIRPAKPQDTVVVEFSPDGGYQVRKRGAAQQPTPRIVPDYRTVEGSVDYRTDRMPNQVVVEQYADPLEAAMDRILSGKKNLATPPKKQQSTPPQLPDQGRFVRQTVAVPQVKPANRISSEEPGHGSVPPSAVGSKSVNVDDSKNTAPQTEHTIKAFYYPFFDKRNSHRFMLDFLTGTLALYMSLNLFRFLTQFAFSSKHFTAGDSLGVLEVFQFLGEYMLGMLPFGVWFVFLAINAMTLFIQTKNGDDRVEIWAHFRTDFAFQYFFWGILIGGISLIPGQLISACLYEQGYPLWRLLFIPVSLYFLGPILFLSVTHADTGLELLQKRIWKSLIFQPLNWMGYYLLALPLCTGFVLACAACYLLVACFLEVNFFVIQLLFLPAAPVLCQLFRWSIYLYFRLLGTHDWKIYD